MPVTFQSVSGGRLSLWLQLGWMDGGPAEVAGKEHKKVKWKMLRKCGRSILCGAGRCDVVWSGVGGCWRLLCDLQRGVERGSRTQAVEEEQTDGRTGRGRRKARGRAAGGKCRGECAQHVVV